MAEADLQGLFASIDAAMGAGIKRAEDDAAADLAFSLLQDRSLQSRLSTRASCFELDGGRVALAKIGEDFVLGHTERATVIAPMNRVAYSEETASADAARPAIYERRFYEVCRELARSRVPVTVHTTRSRYEGIIEAAGPDHIALQSDTSRVVVPGPLIEWISCALGGLTDAT